jgi:type IV secretion system protein VirB11
MGPGLPYSLRAISISRPSNKSLGETVYLDHYLGPLGPWLEANDVTDIYINRANEIWVERLGGAIERITVKRLDQQVLERLSRQIAAQSAQGINREHPLLSASLPDGSRVQIAVPPATRGDVAIAIRKYVVTDMDVDDYARAGAFDGLSRVTTHVVVQEQMRTLQAKGDYARLLKLAVSERCNIFISGGTSSGKTTFLNALLKEIDPAERLILIEDTPELRAPHENLVGMIAARSALGEAVVTMEDLLNASLRMHPDRIILGELRGPEAFTFLRAINTGHPGSMTTIHADSPERAIEQLVLLVLESGTHLDRDSITHYVRSSIDVYVQLGRVDGRRQVTAIELRA